MNLQSNYELRIERLDVLLIAGTRSAAVGWCGIQRFAIRPDAEPEWLIAGLTVIPEARRQGVAARLLHEVLRLTGEAAPGEPIFSVIKARNPASIDLHEGLGFVEVERAALDRHRVHWLRRRAALELALRRVNQRTSAATTSW